jgi:LuxR family maltose regulon positive regulatory protein
MRSGAAAGLLVTKLRAPSPRRDLVPRPALVEQLGAERGRKLTLVAAPAGWGKTTLLASWEQLHRGARPFAWLSIDSGDNDPVRFWMYLIESIRTVEPSVGEDALSLLRAPGVPLIERVIPTLINELEPVCDPLILVLDDYHLIERADIHETVGFLLEHAHPPLQLVISTRSDPPLPLPRMRARGELLEIRADELRFTLEESGAFLNDVLGLGLDHEGVLRLHDRTEGWAAGLYLAALSLRGRPDRGRFIADFAGDDRHVVDYLGAEVLRNQPEDVRTFLLHTSILDRLSGPLCDAVAETPDSAAILRKIERANLFLAPLDAKRDWYRYHHLFRDLLQLELRHAEPELEPELHRRAAAWYLEAGLVSDAVNHTLAACDFTAAGALIAAHWAPLLMGRGEHWTVRAWFEALPQTLVEGDARLCVARVINCLGLGQLEEAKRWVQAGERATPSGPYLDGFTSHEAAVATVRSAYLVLVGDLSGTIAAAEIAAALEGEEAPWHGVVATSAAMARRWQGLLDEAARGLEEYLWNRRGDEQGSFAAWTLGNLAAIEADRGNWDSAERLATEAAELSEAMGTKQHWGTASIHLAIAKVAEHRGAFAEAQVAAERAVALHRYGGPPQARAYALLTLATISAAAGDRARGRECMAEARRQIAEAVEAGVVPALIERAARRLGAAVARPEISAPDELSERELAVLRLFPSRLSQREIGAELYVSVNTVKSHSKSLFRKLGASSRAEAVARAHELGLL